MGSPLDPVTGLPMVGVPDVVSQIPLGVQVVPWDDTKAVDRPQGGPAYPNDIINTFAWVTGENVSQPGTVHAGTMTADRRFRVDTGSTGSGPPVATSVWSGYNNPVNPNNSSLVAGPIPITNYLIMLVQWDVMIAPSDISNDNLSLAKLTLLFLPSGKATDMAFMGIGMGDLVGNGFFGGNHQVLSFPGGFDIRPQIGAGDTQYRVLGEAGNAKSFISAAIYTSP